MRITTQILNNHGYFQGQKGSEPFICEDCGRRCSGIRSWHKRHSPIGDESWVDSYCKYCVLDRVRNILAVRG